MTIPAQPTEPGDARSLPVPAAAPGSAAPQAGNRLESAEGAGPPEADARAEGAAPSPVGRLAATVDRLRREVRAAQAEADGRALVELAKGILVERLGCGPAEAAQQLSDLAEQAGTTALEFAVDVINQAAKDRVSEVTEAFLAAVTGTEDPAERSAAVRLRPRRAERWRRRTTPRRSPTHCSSTRWGRWARWRWRSGRWAPTVR